MKIQWANVKTSVAKAVLSLAKVTSSASAWLMFFGLCGPALIIAGIYILLGLGWALVAGGLACLVIAWLIAKGVANA